MLMQITLFDPNTLVKSYADGAWGHYSQLIWAKSKKVGCGFIYYYKDNFYNQVS